MTSGLASPGAEILCFVCTANVIRSPLAAALLTQRIGAAEPRIAIMSAGLVVDPAQVAPPDARAVAEHMRVDLSGHRARALTEDLIKQAQLVLTMTHDHRGAVMRRDVTAYARVFTIAEFVRLSARGAGPTRPSAAATAAHALRSRTAPVAFSEDVPDPIGQPLAEMRRIGRRLETLVDGVAAVLRGHTE